MFVQDIREDGWTFEFCKTERKPYDLIVCAVLGVLETHINGPRGDAIAITSDGKFEWREPLHWAARVLGRPIPAPRNVRNRTTQHRGDLT